MASVSARPARTAATLSTTSIASRASASAAPSVHTPPAASTTSLPVPGSRASVATTGEDIELSDLPTQTEPIVAIDDVQAPTRSRQLAISIASFFVIFTSCGMLFSFGVYQEIYQAMSLEPNTPFTGASAAAIDIIGTLTATFQTMGAPITTAFIRRFSPRVAIFTSAVLFIASSLLASYSQHLWQFVLTQGVLMGLATCFAYMTPCTGADLVRGAARPRHGPHPERDGHRGTSVGAGDPGAQCQLGVQEHAPRLGRDHDGPDSRVGVHHRLGSIAHV
ncbi:hypothetical protein A1Q2_03150 [Trichosporon asahii var. asahii CBS 8904]|uniref:Major facilitator superfamily (MFS) profile domain-containing protein n=1 Tax=Trichosporon asahii var. asahii (strain CBS 8904) TaxID=1220162 RepID=K1WN78_TRIAC|nr:hypothetical protein A1Q2_03150 [Trichosporon asahii var. asahii CBS 8904]